MTLPPSEAILPTTLVDRDQWVCWRSQDRDTTTTKVPIIPGTTQFASTTDPETWRSFQTAREAVTSTPVAGLGFVFTAEDPLIGIDLDECRDPETGEPTGWAARIIDQLESYTEVSPSGTGYHILVTGELPEGRNRAGTLELYDRSRFFTVTGDHLDTTPPTIAARSEAVATLHESELPDETTEASPETDASATTAATAKSETSTAPAAANTPAAAAVSDEDLLKRAQTAANGEKFTRLWNGITSGYESQSEADLALCRLLAFWTGGDAQRVDRLFRRSGLIRDKWDTVHYADGTTYGEKTVERAIAHTDDAYTPPETATAGDADGQSGATGGGASDNPDTAADATADPPTQEASSAVASTAAEPDQGPTADAAPTDAPDRPATHPQRVQARRARIEELTERVESLMAENERLRDALQEERERRQEREAAREEPSDGWWPLW